MRGLAVLDERADNGDPGRPQQLLELGEVLAGRQRGNAHSSLLGPARPGTRPKIGRRFAP